jgi:hypothetical protein
MKLLATLALSAFAFPVYAETLTIVGSPELVEDRGESCSDYIDQTPNEEGEITLCPNKALHFRYSVLNVVQGVHTEPSINFIGFYHYDGFPDYVQYGAALIILREEEGRYFLEYIDAAIENDDGDWEVCNEWSEDGEADCLERVNVADFVRE